MIEGKVTLILGAGASNPYGFPLGRELKDKIIDQILYSRQPIIKSVTLSQLLEPFNYSEEELQKFAIQLRNSMQPSVDAFLFDRPEFMEIGKLAIASNLIKQEDRELLMSYELNKWYDYLLDLMGTRSEFKENNLSIITFNYDRSLEYFFYYVLKARFNLDDQEAVEYIQSIDIVHFYGQLGKPQFLDPNGRDYENIVNHTGLRKSIDGISLIHEKQNEKAITKNMTSAHEIIKKTKKLIFIGFGYHKENIERLKLKEYYTERTIIGTFHGMKSGEIERAKIVIGQNLASSSPIGHNIVVYNMDAHGFLRETNHLI